MNKIVTRPVTANGHTPPIANTGSFRDPTSRVYESRLDSVTRVFRGMDLATKESYDRLTEQRFFQKLIKNGEVINGSLSDADDSVAHSIMADGWAGVVEHELISFTTYPYEWSFSMLKDAALLQLRIVERCLEHGWTLKDATPYNVQWRGSRPVFIDIGSFEPWIEGEPWVGYRQFCSTFLTPLLMRAHLKIDYLPLIRSSLDGIPPTEAVKYFQGLKRLRKGVLSHIVFPARIENMIANRERDDAPAERRAGNKQSKAMVLGLVQSLARLVRKLDIDISHSDWSRYDKTHTYNDADFEEKKAFVEKHAASKFRNEIWDIGCNTGTFSRLCSDHCNQVIAIDGDHNAVEQLYLQQKGDTDSNILSLVMNLANISPAQGWAGQERLSLAQRGKPDLILCLALIHHVRLTSNIPNAMFLDWLRGYNAEIILEFVDRSDEMVIKLLTNKKEQYEDYNLEQFVSEVEQHFDIRDRRKLKGGKREVFYLTPR